MLLVLHKSWSGCGDVKLEATVDCSSYRSYMKGVHLKQC